MSELPGHALYREGAPVRVVACRSCQATPEVTRRADSRACAGLGHARCQCGAVSEHFESIPPRRRWHQAHKAELYALREQIDRENALRALESRIAKGAPDECWPVVRGYRSDAGYGQITVGCRPIGAHSLMYQAYVGPIPDGLMIRHTCDNPPCCNPAHLLVGTYLDNKLDSVVRDRHAWHERHGCAKLTEAQVAEIREIYGPSKGKGNYGQGIRQYEMAERYGVHPSVISHIVNYRSWRPAA